MHLDAALALWDYAQRSATWALERTTGDPLAHQIHAGAQTRTARRADPHPAPRSAAPQPHHHRSLHQALAKLADDGKLTSQRVLTAGRPAQLWTATR